MRVFDVTILIVTGTTINKIEERIQVEDFHEACIAALTSAIEKHGRILFIDEFKQPPRLVS